MKASQTGFNPLYSDDAPTLEEVNAFVNDVLLEFGAPWCGHCLAAELAVKEVVNEHVNLPHIKIYDGKGKALGRAFKVRRWPTLIHLHNGQEVARLVRPTNADEIRTCLNRI